LPTVVQSVAGKSVKAFKGAGISGGEKPTAPMI
jgi:hypothetical protein